MQCNNPGWHCQLIYKLAERNIIAEQIEKMKIDISLNICLFLMKIEILSIIKFSYQRLPTLFRNIECNINEYLLRERKAPSPWQKCVSRFLSFHKRFAEALNKASHIFCTYSLLSKKIFSIFVASLSIYFLLVFFLVSCLILSHRFFLENFILADLKCLQNIYFDMSNCLERCNTFARSKTGKVITIYIVTKEIL